MSDEKETLLKKDIEADVRADVEKQVEEEYNRTFLGYFIRAIHELVGIFFFTLAIVLTSGNINHFIFGFWVILTFFGSYSGGQVNPAISLGFYFYEMDWGRGFIKLILYWSCQLIGAFSAAKLGSALNKTPIFVTPGHSSAVEIFISEFLFTGTFLFFILFVCSPKTSPCKNEAIKCAIIVGWFHVAVQMGGPISGAAYNPAILGALNTLQWLYGNESAINHVWQMIFAEFSGAIVFSLLFKYVFEKLYPTVSGKRDNQKVLE